ncbi:thioredoxin 1 [Mesonia phycicola]|uniref:Thioredoxin n=1 Tax=Mesonia phycicola TaxID=579105 RepID=A0A1M6ETC6_9FLAO|nr:thioredoxin family protein [Mesonia phycicola]SHI88658.1 thioredoxin 1 [Mesonia phycicola]
MSKFGDLINLDVPVLLDFYTDWDESSTVMSPILKDVAAAIGDKGKVIKIDVDKNVMLANALRVKSLPTLILYKNGEMVWRKSGEEDANTLINLIQQHLQEEI